MKTKRQILIDRRIFTVGLLVIIGLYCVLRGMSGIVQTTHALSIDRLTGTGCKNGRYVAGYIDSYVVKGNNEHYTGVSGNLNEKSGSHSADRRWGIYPITALRKRQRGCGWFRSICKRTGGMRQELLFFSL